MGTLSLRKWTLRDTLCDDIYWPTGAGLNFRWTVVERIGLMNDFPFTPNITMFADCSFPSDFNYSFILCKYSDDTYSYTIPCSEGIDETINKKRLHLYPNPANEIMNLSIDDLSTPVEIIISNVMGQTLDRFLLAEEFNFSVKKLPAGYYFLKCISPKYTTTTPFIINR